MSFKVPESTRISNVHLQVSNLESSLRFYSKLLGFKIIEINSNIVYLSATGHYPCQIIMSVIDNSTERPYRTTGLYHIGIRVPNRIELATILKRLLDSNWHLCGLSNHTVSESIYLTDPDDNGVEIYADSPKKNWINNLHMSTTSLNPRSLLDELSSNNSITWKDIDPQTDIGHIHLQVSNLKKTADFYQHVIGFNVTWRSSPGAIFLAAGSYHHHIALNTWSSKDAIAPPTNSVGLISFSLEIDNLQSLNSLNKHLLEYNYTFKSFSNNGNDGVLLHDPDGVKIQIVTNKKQISSP
ncbi:hypothetical protein F8154_11490 [Alkaliphilus pronyensis]|uniref:VOC domain-containing protein n=1 Tax=Alkaliphilus pronyensis TaxID=1482732 RepID=A0A6I0EZP7_9FIRM|nr:VOC family protein [Alkaliphilus pronyensis]KAB3532764.1 hypothetical protein F8154_11490 [Alkaliphilus pronyensis]